MDDIRNHIPTFMLRSLIHRFRSSNSVKQNEQFLDLHKKLLYEGIQTTAEVLGTMIEDDKIGKLFPVKLYLKMKNSDHQYEYIHTKALLTLQEIPEKGKMIQIRYAPNNLNLVMIK